MIVDDHKLFLEGLQYLLEAYKVNIVGKARNGREAITKARILMPDIILMDIMMPDMDGIDALKIIKAEMPDIKVIMLTTSDDHEDIFEAIKLGASGYLVKNTDGKELINKIKQVEDGEIPLSPVLAAKILSEFNKKQDNTEKGTIRDDANTENEKLNSRQLELLALIASGKTYKKVGEILGLSERTVKYHMGRIVDILHLDNKAQVIAYAVESGMVSTNISNKNT
ncbi:MAG: response regulator transcription factor [Clostridiales bacterium]|jgi:two-component system NarL family response regulator|nr:response regulator transcription factor [Clostridiales bacterium]